MQDLLLKAFLAALSNRPKPIQHYLTRHFNCDPRKNAIVRIDFPRFRHGCVSRALQRCLREDGGRGEVLGTLSTESDIELIEYLHPDSYDGQTVGPVQFCDIELKDGKHLSCPKVAFYLLRNKGKRLAIYLSRMRYEEKVSVEIMAKDRREALAFLQKLKILVDELSIYKGAVISMTRDKNHELVAEFCTVPKISREQVILPPVVLADVERMTISFSKHKERMLAQKRHLKRGLLLYGPPGTGKSLTVMHLISEMPGRTTVLLTGSTIEWMADACNIARSLQPATVVIDDVDLIASERSQNAATKYLFELLNQMDGISDDADILFLLTTNKPQALEPAIAARPGRIDQAIEVPLPSRACRQKLFDLYAKGLQLELVDMEQFIDKTDGANAAFIREMLRKAVLFAAESEEGDMVVRNEHLDAALNLLTGSNLFTCKFLGFEKISADAGESQARFRPAPD